MRASYQPFLATDFSCDFPLEALMFDARDTHPVRRLKTFFRAIIVGVVAIVVPTQLTDLLPSGCAHAQMMFGGGMGDAAQTITKRSLDGYAKILNLNEDQHTAAKSLLEAYQASTRSATEKFDKEMKVLQEDFADTQDFREFQKQIGEKAKTFAAAGKKLEENFFEDLKAVLDDTQAEEWPRVERFHRRETLLRFGMVSGAGVDLLAALARVKIEPQSSQELAEAAARYETDMDQLLVVMERDQKAQQDGMLSGEGAFDPTQIQTMMKAMYESAAKVRDLNRETHRKFLAAVPADRAEAYAHEFNRRSFPRVYRTTHTTKLLKAAAGFADVTEDQKSEIARLTEDYNRSLAPANDKWAKAVEEQEDAAGGTMMVMMQGFSGQGGGNSEVTDARKVRKELDNSSKERLLAVLTDEQEARLPEPDEPKDNGFGGFFSVADEDDEE